MTIQRALKFVLLICILSPYSLYAQDNKDTGPHQVGVLMGRVLPNGVTEEDEIFSLWGLRYSIPSGRSSYYDLGLLHGNSGGVDWQGAFATIRMDIPVETLIGHAGIGLDFTRFETDLDPTTNEAGAHFVGGLMTRIGGNSIFRFDMKLNSKPGTSLFFALGIVIELDGDETNAN